MTDHQSIHPGEPLSLRLEGDLSFLRRLAGSLLRDPADVDDAIQETVRRALASGERSVEHRRAWLAQVLSNVVRGEWRRLRPVSETGLGEASTEELEPESVALRLERARVLHEELGSLPSSYRDVLVLRFGDDLPVALVASRLGLSESAVHSRLSRGKGLLRERLERREGGSDRWIHGLIPLVAAPRATRESAAVGAGALALSASLAAVALVAWAWIASTPEAPSAADVEASVTRPEEADLALVDVEDADTPAREESARILEVELSEAASTGSLVYAIKDQKGNPVAGVPVHVVVASGAGSTTGERSIATGPDGVARFFDVPAGEFRIFTGTRAHHAPWRPLEAGDTVTLNSTWNEALEMELVLPKLEAQSPITLWSIEGRHGIPQSFPICELERGSALKLRAKRHVSFFAAAPGRAPSPVVYVPHWMAEHPGEAIRIELEPGERARPVEGSVTDASGRPLESALVVLKGPDRWRATSRTDFRGAFRSPFGIPEGEVPVEVHAAGHGMLRTTLTHRGKALRAPLILGEERPIRGTVVDGNGDPRAGIQVLAYLSGEHFPTSGGHLDGTAWLRPETRTAKDGTFTIRGLGREDVVLFLDGWTEEGEPISDRHRVSAGQTQTEDLRMVLAEKHLLEGQITTADGTPLEGLRVELYARGLHDDPWTETDAQGIFRVPAPHDEEWPRGTPARLRVLAQYRVGDGLYDLPYELIDELAVEIGGPRLQLQAPEPPPGSAGIQGRLALGTAPGIPGPDDLSLHLQCTPVTKGIEERRHDPESGQFNAQGIPAGTYSLYVTRKADMQVLLTRTGIELGPSETLDLGDVTLNLGGTVEVTVVDAATGEDLSERVEDTSGWIELDRDPNGLGPRLQFDGSVWRSLSPIEPGRWSLALARSDWKIAAPLEIEVADGGLHRATLLVTARR